MRMKKQTPERKGNRSQNLELRGYRVVTNHDKGSRFLSFLMDLCVMLAPIMIWNIIMLAVLGSIVSITGIMVVNIVIGIMLVGTILFLNSYIYKQTKGQSLGMRTFSFKVILSNGKTAPDRVLVLREVIGFALPFIVLMLFLNVFGVLIYWGVNGLFVLLDKQHRSLIDIPLKTCVVALLEPVETQRVERPEVKKQVAPTAPQIRRSIDLHIHSNFSSNGDYNVEEIFQNAKKKGLKTISITDLDSAKSNNIAVRMSELYAIHYVPGIEINCDLHGRRVRLLGYFIDYASDLYAHIENESLVNEKYASIERVRRFEQVIHQRIDIDHLLYNNRFQKIPGELIARHVLTRPEYQACPELQPYLYGSKRENAYRELSKDFFAYGKACYVPVKYPLLQDVLDVISLTNGISVIAHPGKLLSQDPRLLEEALALGVQGIEVFHPMHSRKEMADLLKCAKEKKLFVTCGSGFYRKNSGVELGDTMCPKEAESIVNMLIRAKI